jgi:WD40 repeat protein
MVFSPNGQTLVTETSGIRGVNGDVTARLWDARTGKSLALPLQHAALIGTVTFSPDGRTVATKSQGIVRLWDTSTGKSLAPPLQHEQPVRELVFSPDSRTLATGSADAIRLWGARTGRPLTSPQKIQGWVKTVAFKPNGKTFFVATDHWLNTYSWDGRKAVPLNSQLLHGYWKGSFRFSSDCERCLQVALGDTGNSFHLETLHLDEPADPPIEGDPKELLEKWKSRLGLTFDEQMRPVPAVGLAGVPAGALSDGRRSPRDRQR